MQPITPPVQAGQNQQAAQDLAEPSTRGRWGTPSSAGTTAQCTSSKTRGHSALQLRPHGWTGTAGSAEGAPRLPLRLHLPSCHRQRHCRHSHPALAGLCCPLGCLGQRLTCKPSDDFFRQPSQCACPLVYCCPFRATLSARVGVGVGAQKWAHSKVGAQKWAHSKAQNAMAHCNDGDGTMPGAQEDT